MVKEYYKKRIKDQNLKFQDDSVVSEYIREEDVTSLRLYVTGLLGVAGTAKTDFNKIELEKKALENAKHNPYPVDASHSLQQKIIYRYEISSEKNYKEAMVLFIEELKKHLPDYQFHGQMSLIDREESLSNEMSLQLQYKDHYMMMSMGFRQPGDTISVPFFYRGRRYSREVFSQCVQKLGLAWSKKAVIKNTKVPILFSSANRALFSYLLDNVNGRKVGAEESPYSGKLNHLLWNPLLTLYSSHDIENLITPFFDMEGSVVRMENDPLSPFRCNLIQNGVFVSPYTDKRTALKYNYPLTGSAVGTYKDIPFPGVSHFQVHSTHESLVELLQRNVGILVVNATDIQHKSEGDFSCITKVAFLTDGESLLGRLPCLKIESNSQQIFGEDYLGSTRHLLFPLYSNKLVGFYANIQVI